MDKQRLEEQYQEMADIVECEGLGYALLEGGYLKPQYTDDEELKQAIIQAEASCQTIMRILRPYMP